MLMGLECGSSKQCKHVHGLVIQFLIMLIYSVYAKMSKPIAKLVHLHSIIIDVTDGTGHHGISYKSEYRQHIVNTIFSKRGKSYTNSKINHF